MTLQEREDLLIARYGEVTTKKEAGRILSKASTTINGMLNDGRLDYACGGTMVDVRSIARYIMQPAAEDSRARQVRKGRSGKYVLAV